MFNKLFISLSVAIQNVRTHLFHTLLSILGVVIGVAALVAILCLIDGVEKSIRETISETISLQSITIESNRYETLDGVRVEKESIPVITPAHITLLAEEIEGIASAKLEKDMNDRFYLASGSDTIGVHVSAVWRLESEKPDTTLLAGRLLRPEDKANVTVLNEEAAEKLELKPDELLDKRIVLKGEKFTIVGITESEKDAHSDAVIPISVMSALQSESNSPELTVEAEKFEEVDRIKDEIGNWLDEEFAAGSEAFSIHSNKLFFQQASKGMLFFKVFMGMITGISVLVGGVGIMNVLLISIKERTKEIGVRKATGARRKDIALQFLSESVTISALGSLLGLIVGFLGAVGLAFVIGELTETAFQAAFTWGTLAVVAVVAFLIGIVFGTYPAMKAARLTPVDAIRHE